MYSAGIREFVPHAHAHAPAHTHVYTHTHTNTHTHTHIHSHTQTHTQMQLYSRHVLAGVLLLSEYYYQNIIIRVLLSEYA